MSMNPFIRIFCAVLCACPTVWSETVEWSLGYTIDCPVTVVASDQERTRALVLPCQSITSYSMSAKPKDLVVKQGDRNTLIIRLTNPAYETNLQVWDENQNLYTFLVRSPAEGESPDDTLILKRARQIDGPGSGSVHGGLEPVSAQKIINEDTDGAAVNMMSQMVGGITDPKIRWANVVTNERGGKVRVGRRLHDSDDLTITLIKTFRAPTLFGYQCMLEWHGDQNVTFQLQRWYRPGMICCATSDQIVMEPVDPYVRVPAHRTIHVWYITDAGYLHTDSAGQTVVVPGAP